MRSSSSFCLFTYFFFFFFNDTATTEIYTLSLHDALPITVRIDTLPIVCFHASKSWRHENIQLGGCQSRSEERFSRNAETDLVWRLLLETKHDGLRVGAGSPEEGADEQIEWVAPARLGC